MENVKPEKIVAVVHVTVGVRVGKPVRVESVSNSRPVGMERVILQKVKPVQVVGGTASVLPVKTAC